MEERHSGHGPSEDAARHPSLRKLGEGAVEEARRLFGEGRGPKEVLGVLRGWNGSVTAQDVYNLKAKIGREMASGGGGGAKGTKGGLESGTGDGEESGMDGVVPTQERSGVVAVDPELHAQSGGQAPAARMLGERTVEPVDGAGNITGKGDGTTRKGKCECKCCEH